MVMAKRKPALRRGKTSLRQGTSTYGHGITYLKHGKTSLDSILAKYRPINADDEAIKRIRRMYSKLSPEIYEVYDQAWECLMRHIPQDNSGKSATISNLGFLCLLDLERTLFLQQVISRTISMSLEPSQLNAIDLGAGTGILGLTALELGIGSVTLVENDKECLEFIEKLLCEMGYSQITKEEIANKDYIKKKLAKKGYVKIFSKTKSVGQDIKPSTQTAIIYLGDAKSFSMAELKSSFFRPHKYDLILCEMHETHLVSEDEVPALQNIRKHARPDAVFIPSSDSLMISICDEEGHNLSAPLEIGSVDFGNIQADRINFKGKLLITKSGQAKYLKLWDRLYYPDNTICEQDFQMFSQTKYMLLKGWEPKLKKGQSLILTAKFRFADPFYNGYSLELAGQKKPKPTHR